MSQRLSCRNFSQPVAGIWLRFDILASKRNNITSFINELENILSSNNFYINPKQIVEEDDQKGDANFDILPQPEFEINSTIASIEQILKVTSVMDNYKLLIDQSRRLSNNEIELSSSYKSIAKRIKTFMVSIEQSLEKEKYNVDIKDILEKMKLISLKLKNCVFHYYTLLQEREELTKDLAKIPSKHPDVQNKVTDIIMLEYKSEEFLQLGNSKIVELYSLSTDIFNLLDETDPHVTMYEDLKFLDGGLFDTNSIIRSLRDELVNIVRELDNKHAFEISKMKNPCTNICYGFVVWLIAFFVAFLLIGTSIKETETKPTCIVPFSLPSILGDEINATEFKIKCSKGSCEYIILNPTNFTVDLGLLFLLTGDIIKAIISSLITVGAIFGGFRLLHQIIDKLSKPHYRKLESKTAKTILAIQICVVSASVVISISFIIYKYYDFIFNQNTENNGIIALMAFSALLIALCAISFSFFLLSLQNILSIKFDKILNCKYCLMFLVQNHSSNVATLRSTDLQ